MAESTAEHLDALRRMIERAKAVPMSASCMINRAEALELVAAARTALAAELDATRAAAEASPSVLERAKEQAAEVVREAEEEANRLVEDSEVLRAAHDVRTDCGNRRTPRPTRCARRPTSTWTAGSPPWRPALQKTLSQIQTMRARLASRYTAWTPTPPPRPDLTQPADPAAVRPLRARLTI